MTIFGKEVKSLRAYSLLKSKLTCIIALITVVAFMPALMSCIGDRAKRITISNESENIVWINFNIVTKNFSGAYALNPKSNNDGQINPGESIILSPGIPVTQKLGEQIGKYVITAITENGSIVYQKIFTWTELRDSGWRVEVSEQHITP